jgi:hypothetical protein
MVGFVNRKSVPVIAQKPISQSTAELPYLGIVVPLEAECKH